MLASHCPPKRIEVRSQEAQRAPIWKSGPKGPQDFKFLIILKKDTIKDPGVRKEDLRQGKCGLELTILEAYLPKYIVLQIKNKIEEKRKVYLIGDHNPFKYC